MYKIMLTTGTNGVKNWWYSHAKSSRQSVYVLIQYRSQNTAFSTRHMLLWLDGVYVTSSKA